MRILVVHNFYKIPGGEDSVFRNETRLLEEHGDQVFTYTRDNREMGIWDLVAGSVFSKKTYREVREIIRSKEIELVHVHNERFLISPSVFKAAEDEGIPVVQTLHNFRLMCANAQLYRDGSVCRECVKDGGTRFFPALRHACYRNSRILTFFSLRIGRYRQKHCLNNVYYIALTDFNRELLSRSLIKPERIYVKPNFTPDLLQDTEVSNERKGFAYIGRLDPLKGIGDILNVWENLPEDIVLTVAGTGEEAYIERLKERYSRPNIRFTGMLDRDGVSELLSKSKALIFASRWYEGFPMTIIESFSKGTPVIGLDFGNAGCILKGIYRSEDACLKDIDELNERILDFDGDRDRGLYDFDRESLKPYTPEENYRILKGIYRDITGDRT